MYKNIIIALLLITSITLTAYIVYDKVTEPEPQTEIRLPSRGKDDDFTLACMIAADHHDLDHDTGGAIAMHLIYDEPRPDVSFKKMSDFFITFDTVYSGFMRVRKNENKK